MKKIAIFASGSGSNAEEIINFFSQRTEICQVSVVITNNLNAYVLQRAVNHSIPSKIFSARDFRENSAQILSFLQELGIDFIVLAGFMLLMPADIVSAYSGRIVNIHPALLPKFGGKGMYGDNVHRAVIEAGESESGITIHFVNEKYDEGAIIFQAKCEITSEDNAESLANKIHALEHKHFPEVIAQIINKL